MSDYKFSPKDIEEQSAELHSKDILSKVHNLVIKR